MQESVKRLRSCVISALFIETLKRTFYLSYKIYVIIISESIFGGDFLRALVNFLEFLRPLSLFGVSRLIPRPEILLIIGDISEDLAEGERGSRILFLFIFICKLNILG